MFFKIFDSVYKRFKAANVKPNSDQEKTLIENIVTELDFTKVFNFLFETMRGLLIFAKEGEFDKLFIEENIIHQLAQVILMLYCEHSEFVLKLTSKTVNKKVITNDD